MTQSPDITYIPIAPRIFIAHNRGDRLTWLPELPDGERRQKAKPPVAPPPDGLRTPREAARKLHCSVKTLNGHVASGALRYVIIGHGMKRPRRMFADADINDFIAAQTRKVTPCPSIRTGTADRRTGITTSKSKVIGFMEARSKRRDAKPKR